MADSHPLAIWMAANEISDEGLANRLPSAPHQDSIRLIRQGHRRPSWDLAFEIEKKTGVSAHALRNPKFYRNAA